MAGDEDSETEKLLQDNSDEEESEETTQKLYYKKSAFFVLYLTMFFNALMTSIVYSSLWSYLKQIDPTTGTWYLGIVHAGFNSGELCFIILNGIWVQYRRAIEPLTASMLCFIAGSLVYAWASGFGFHDGKYMIFAARVLVGCASGNDVIVTTLLSEATSLKDRTKAMAYLALSQSFGFTLGPAIQACFVPIGGKGVYIKGIELHINMFTTVGLLCALFGILNLAGIIWIRQQLIVSPTSSEDVQKESNGNRKDSDEKGSGIPSDKLAMVAVLVLFFITRHSLVFTEVMFVPVAMDQYALSSKDTLEIVGGLFALIGVIAAIVFVLTDQLAARVGDRMPLVVSIFVTFLGFAVLWPASNIIPKMGHYYNATIRTESGLTTVVRVSLGCSPTHDWCSYTPLILLPQFITGFILTTLSFPVAYCILPSLFTKIIQPGRQGILVSIFSISGNLSRILGPTLFTLVYSGYGPKAIFGIIDVALFVAFLISAIFYKQLLPYSEYVKKKSKSRKTTEKDKLIPLTGRGSMTKSKPQAEGGLVDR